MAKAISLIQDNNYSQFWEHQLSDDGKSIWKPAIDAANMHEISRQNQLELIIDNALMREENFYSTSEPLITEAVYELLDNNMLHCIAQTLDQGIVEPGKREIATRQNLEKRKETSFFAGEIKLMDFLNSADQKF